MLMNLLMDIAGVKEGFQFPLAFTLVYVVGFIAAISIGLIAWYNSKRPPGWEDAKRPDFIPKIGNDDSDSSNPE